MLSFLAEGLSYKMIADKMGISYNTVNGHVKNIYQKLHVASLGEAIAYYYKHLKQYKLIDTYIPIPTISDVYPSYQGVLFFYSCVSFVKHNTAKRESRKPNRVGNKN